MGFLLDSIGDSYNSILDSIGDPCNSILDSIGDPCYWRSGLSPDYDGCNDSLFNCALKNDDDFMRLFVVSDILALSCNIFL